MASREEIDMLITGADRLARQRQEQRERYKQRTGRSVPQEAEAQAILRNMPGEVSGIGLEDYDDETFAFGQEQSELQKRTTDDYGYEAARDPETKASYAIKRPFEEDRPLIKGPVTRTTYDRSAPKGQRAKETTSMETIGYEGDTAPSAALQDALDYLKSGPEKYGYSAFPGAAQAAGNLEMSISPRLQRQADAALGAETVRRDLQNTNPVAAIRNELRFRDALENASNLSSYQSLALAQARRNLSRANIVGASNTGVDVEALRYGGRYIDPRTGGTIAVDEPLTTAIAGSNTPNTHQELNAPTSQSAVDFVVDQVKGVGTPFEGKAVMQPNIGASTAGFVDAVRALENRNIKGKGLVFGGPNRIISEGRTSINTIDELQKVSDLILRLGADAGISFPRTVSEGGRPTKVKTDTPGVPEVMEYLRIAPAQQQELAIALRSLETATEGGGRQTGAPIERIKAGNLWGETGNQAETVVARAPDRIQTIFRKAESPGARAPFIGAEEGDVRKATKTPGGVQPGDDADAFIRRQAADRAIENMKGKEGKAILDEAAITRNQDFAREVREGAGAQGQFAQERRKRQAAADAVSVGLTTRIGDTKEREMAFYDAPTKPSGNLIMTPSERQAMTSSVPSITPSGNPQPAVNPVVRAAQTVAPPERAPIIPRPMTDVAGEAIGIGREIADRARRSRIGTAAGITGLGIGAGTVLNLLFGGDDE